MKEHVKFIVVPALILGVIATIVLLYIPDWMQVSRTKHAHNIISSLTPERLLVLCGKPDLDSTEPQSGGAVVREVGYRAGTVLSHAQVVRLTFAKGASGNWSLRAFHIGVDVTPDKAYVEKFDPEEEIGLLPCLDSQSN